MKITGIIFLFIASILFVNVAQAEECRTEERYQICALEPGTTTFAGPAELQAYLVDKVLVYIGKVTTTKFPNPLNRPMGSVTHVFLNIKSQQMFGVGYRTDGEPMELLHIMIPSEGA